MSDQPVAHPAPSRRAVDLRKAWGSVVALAIIAFLLGRLDLPGLRQLAFIVGVTALWLPTLWLCLLAAHLGNIVMGRLLGFRFVAWIYGPLRLSRRRYSPGLRLSRNRSVELYTGLVSYCPLDDRDLPRRLERYVASGLTGVLGLTVILLTLALIAHGTTIGWLLLAMALMTLVLLVPSWRATRMLLQRLKSEEFGDAYTAQQLIGGLELVRSVRPRDWPSDLVERAQRLHDASDAATLGAWLAYLWAVDRGDLQAAGEFMTKMLALRPERIGAVWNGVLIDAAFFDAFHRKNPTAAREHLGRITNEAIDQHNRLRAEAAVLLAEGRPDEACATARAGLEAIRDADYTGRVLAEEDWLRQIMARCA
jgi:hypothetical protein